MATGRQTVRGSLWVLLAQALMAPTGLATILYLSRRLGPEDYGGYALALTLVVSVEIVLLQALSGTTVKRVREAADPAAEASGLVRASVGLGLAAATPFWIFAEPLARALGVPELATPIRLAALDLPILLAAETHLHVLVGLDRLGARAATGAVRWLARLALIVVGVEAGFGIYGAIAGVIGASVTQLLVCRCFYAPPLWARGTEVAGALRRYALPLALGSVSLQVLNRIDLYALKWLGASTAEAGNYAAAMMLALLPLALSGVLAPVLVSEVAGRRAAGDPAGARRVAQRVTRLAVLPLPLVAVVSGSAADLAPWLLGPGYEVAGSVLAVRIFAALALVGVMVCVALLTAAGRPGVVLRATAVLAPLALLGHVLVIPRFGAVGAAGVTTVVAGVALLTCGVGVARTFGLAGLGASAAKATAVAVLGFAASAAWPSAGAGVLLELGLLGLGTMAALWLLGEPDADERALLRTLWTPLPDGLRPPGGG